MVTLVKSEDILGTHRHLEGYYFHTASQPPRKQLTSCIFENAVTVKKFFLMLVCGRQKRSMHRTFFGSHFYARSMVKHSMCTCFTELPSIEHIHHLYMWGSAGRPRVPDLTIDNRLYGIQSSSNTPGSPGHSPCPQLSAVLNTYIISIVSDENVCIIA